MFLKSRSEVRLECGHGRKRGAAAAQATLAYSALEWRLKHRLPGLRRRPESRHEHRHEHRRCVPTPTSCKCGGCTLLELREKRSGVDEKRSREAVPVLLVLQARRVKVLSGEADGGGGGNEKVLACFEVRAYVFAV
jgi:hypothetical protein